MVVVEWLNGGLGLFLGGFRVLLKVIQARPKQNPTFWAVFVQKIQLKSKQNPTCVRFVL